MKLHPQFQKHVRQASVSKCDIDAIIAEKPIELPFIKHKLTLWQRIKRMIR